MLLDYRDGDNGRSPSPVAAPHILPDRTHYRYTLLVGWKRPIVWTVFAGWLQTGSAEQGVATGMDRQRQSAGASLRIAILIVAGLLVLWLAACSSSDEVGALITGPTPDVSTVEANAGATAPAGPRSGPEVATPLFPVSSASCEYGAALMADISTFAGSTLTPGTPFAQTWRVQNSGTCAWNPGTIMFFAAGTLPGIVNQVNVPATPAQGTADVTVGFIAPDTPGEYTSFWQLRMADGLVLDDVFSVRVVVATEASTATSAPEPEPTSAPAPTATTPPELPATAPPIATSTVPPSSTATAEPPATGGWLGEYFNNPWVEGTPLTTRTDPDINFDWGTGAPMPHLPSNRFSVRWTQRLNLEEGNYTFFARSDDGIRVWVDGRLIIDEWQGVQDKTFQASLSLLAGQHDFRVEYYEEIQFARVQFWWEAGSAFLNWRGEYFNNEQLSGSPAMLRDDPAVAFNWGRNSPSANISNDSFSVRWTRSQQFRAGNYRFHILMDDGARVFVDNTLVIDAWQTGNLREVTGNINLSAGTHFLRVEYFERSLEAAVYFWWDTGVNYPDWRGEYWSNQTLSGLPAVTRNDAQVNFYWEFGSPASGIPDDHFSARWARFQNFDSGTYRLNVASDDGVRVFVDGNLVIDRWYNGPADQTFSADLVLEGTHAIIITYYEDRDLASIRFWIERIGNAP